MNGLADIGFLALGFAAGTLHFALLRWNTLLYVRSGALMPAIGVQALRLVVTAAVLFAVAMHGALALLLAAGGVLLVRPVVLRLVP
jgi:F1F0 ATPase subunit 2